MTIEYQAIVLGPGEGKTISAMGVELIYKAVGAETGGQYFCMEYKAPANWSGPPKHIHSKTDSVAPWGCVSCTSWRAGL